MLVGGKFFGQGKAGFGDEYAANLVLVEQLLPAWLTSIDAEIIGNQHGAIHIVAGVNENLHRQPFPDNDIAILGIVKKVPSR